MVEPSNNMSFAGADDFKLPSMPGDVACELSKHYEA